MCIRYNSKGYPVIDREEQNKMLIVRVRRTKKRKHKVKVASVKVKVKVLQPTRGGECYRYK